MSLPHRKRAADVCSRRWFGREDLRTFGHRPPAFPHPRGLGALYGRHVTQADTGCDLDFLQGTARVLEPEIH